MNPHAPCGPMRLLAAAGLLAVALSGCLNTSNPVSPAGAGLPLEVPGVVVHRAGVALPLGPEEVLGAVPRVVEKLLGTRGAEPNLGVTSTGAIFVSSGDLVLRSRDLGDTWEQVYEFGSVHGPNATRATEDPIRNSDPMLWVDAATDRVFNFPMWPILACSWGAWSDDDGETWTERPMACGLPGVDHQKVATGPFVEGGPLRPTGSYPNVVYYCYNKLLTTNCAVSTDGGLTFPVDSVVFEGECAGLNGHPAAAPNGTAFVPIGDQCPTENFVGRSFDNGLTWEVLKIRTGGLGSAETDAEVAVTPDGTSYYFFRALADHKVYVMRSRDAFDTNDGPFLVSPPDVVSTRFLAMAAGSDGRLAFAYLGSRDSAARPGEVPDSARWHLFTTFTLDADAPEPTFVTLQVTPPEDPVQIGYTWEAGGGDPGRNLLDFIDGVVGKDGRFYVAFTDGCTADCAGNRSATKHQSRARDTALAVQVEGPSLVDATDATPPGSPEALAPNTAALTDAAARVRRA